MASRYVMMSAGLPAPWLSTATLSIFHSSLLYSAQVTPIITHNFIIGIMVLTFLKFSTMYAHVSQYRTTIFSTALKHNSGQVYHVNFVYYEVQILVSVMHSKKFFFFLCAFVIHSTTLHRKSLRLR